MTIHNATAEQAQKIRADRKKLMQEMSKAKSAPEKTSVALPESNPGKKVGEPEPAPKDEKAEAASSEPASSSPKLAVTKVDKGFTVMDGNQVKAGPFETKKEADAAVAKLASK